MKMNKMLHIIYADLESLIKKNGAFLTDFQCQQFGKKQTYFVSWKILHEKSFVNL